MLLALWVTSGMAFPIAVGWDAVSGHGFYFYVHFFLSLALCGIAATTYPYLLITFLAVRYFVPALVRRGVIAGPKRQDLQYTAKLNRLYMATVDLVPMLGILMMAAFGSEKAGRWPLVAVSGGGAIGFVAMIALERTIGLDIAALMHIAIDERRAHGGRGTSGRASRSGSASRGSRNATPAPTTRE